MAAKKEIVLKLNKKMSIGIISGAGPMAGIELITSIIKKCQEKGSAKDSHFPEIHLINIPFSEMLYGDIDADQITKEIESGFEKLKSCTHIIIACQTAHLFLPEKLPAGFINLLTLVKELLPQNNTPIVVASRTSVRNKLHDQLLEITCEYYDAEKSQATIDSVLRGEVTDLSWINDLDEKRPVILGCTEYSVPQANTKFNQNIIDPIEIAACRLIDNFFLDNLAFTQFNTGLFSKKTTDKAEDKTATGKIEDKTNSNLNKKELAI